MNPTQTASQRITRALTELVGKPVRVFFVTRSVHFRVDGVLQENPLHDPEETEDEYRFPEWAVFEATDTPEQTFDTPDGPVDIWPEVASFDASAVREIVPLLGADEFASIMLRLLP